MTDIVLSEGTNTLDVQMIPIIVPPPEPSQLLIDYQKKLADCIEDCALGVEWIMLPEYGIQNPCTGIGLMRSLMVDEAIRIGMISSASEAYFVGATMYHISGDPIVPYW